MAFYGKNEFCVWCLDYKANRAGCFCTYGGSERKLYDRRRVPDWCPYKNDVEEFRRIENFPDCLLQGHFGAC